MIIPLGEKWGHTPAPGCANRSPVAGVAHRQARLRGIWPRSPHGGLWPPDRNDLEDGVQSIEVIRVGGVERQS